MADGAQGDGWLKATPSWCSSNAMGLIGVNGAVMRPREKDVGGRGLLLSIRRRPHPRHVGARRHLVEDALTRTPVTAGISHQPSLNEQHRAIHELDLLDFTIERLLRNCQSSSGCWIFVGFGPNVQVTESRCTYTCSGHRAKSQVGIPHRTCTNRGR